jgi:hypothetical protein
MQAKKDGCAFDGGLQKRDDSMVQVQVQVQVEVRLHHQVDFRAHALAASPSR